jgi:hypothetical protein
MKRLLFLAVPALLALAGCDGNPTESKAPVASVNVAPDERTLAVGQTLQLEVVIRDTRGESPLEPQVSWVSENPAVATVDGAGRVSAVSLGTAVVRATVEEKTGSVTVTVAGPPADCAQSGAVRSLAVGEAVTVGGISASVLCLDGGASGKEYLVVPFNAGSTGASAMQVGIATTGTIPVAAASPDRAPALSAAFAAAAREPRRDFAWENAFRRRAGELGRWVDAARGARSAARDGVAKRDELAPRFAVNASSPSVGQTLKINTSTTNCGTPDLRTGRVVAVTQHAVVVADQANPAGGLTDDEYRAFGLAFDTLVYPVDVANFGEPEDVDDNGRAIIFYTRAVNELTPAGSGSYIGGYFHARDLFPTRDRDGLQACEGSNYAEVFYMLVPDPAGAVNSNPRSRQLVLNSSVATLAHEFQHLINASRRLYGLETSNWNEEVWLNEGLSHIAEELVFERVGGVAPGQNLTAAAIQASPQTSAAFSTYGVQNVQRLDYYLRDPELQSPYDLDDDLATRGATWSFLRYAADRKGGSQAVLWKSLVDATVLGLANLHSALGTDPRPWVRDWTVSNFTDDAVPGVAARFTQPSWNFRAVFTNYPLATRRLIANGTAPTALSSGAGAFVRFGVAAAGTGRVSATVGGTTPPSELFVTVVRTR